jgi:alpha-1,2-mannosyltransferase
LVLTSFSLLELDNQYLKYHADKKRRIEERGEKCYGTAPEAMDGAIELLEELYVL